MKWKKMIALSILLCCIAAFCSCTFYPYKEKHIIGRTSSEIVELYGEFDWFFGSDLRVDENGNYCSGACGYKIGEMNREVYPSPMYYMIWFDDEGKAYEIDDIWYIPGG